MKKWIAEIIAIDPSDGELKRWMAHEYIEAPTQQLAQEWCDENERGYYHITDELLSIVETDEDGNPDWDTYEDFELPGLN